MINWFLRLKVRWICVALLLVLVMVVFWGLWQVASQFCIECGWPTEVPAPTPVLPIPTQTFEERDNVLCDMYGQLKPWFEAQAELWEEEGDFEAEDFKGQERLDEIWAEINIILNEAVEYIDTHDMYDEFHPLDFDAIQEWCGDRGHGLNLKPRS